MRKVQRVEYNWFYTTESGSEYNYAEVGKNDVESIHYHAARYCEDFSHYCDVTYKNGRKERVFNINRIVEITQAMKPAARVEGYADNDTLLPATSNIRKRYENENN